MKQKISLQIIFLLIAISCLYGQNTCLPGIIIIKNQEDVDALLENYQDCEIIEGRILIRADGTGEHITNLNVFSQIKEIQGFLQLRDNPVIDDLSGLSNLEKIGGLLYIQNNDLLIDLEGLHNVTEIGGSIFIGQNEVLETLSGLDGVESMDGKLTIRDNDLLNDISSLDGIDPNSIDVNNVILDDLVIINNMSLSECSIENLCELLEIEGRTFEISNNNSGCNNVDEIKENCSVDPTCIPVAKVFNSQQEIDNFPIDFPHCTHILGDITIKESIEGDILNLNGLSQVEIIEGALLFQDNTNLDKLAGLSNLDTIGRFLKIENNPLLNSLSEFTDLQSVNSILLDNSSLINLEGLNNVDSLSGDLTLRRNSNLTSLDGIENLKIVGDKIEIRKNPNLTSIAALSNVISADDLDIYDNDILLSLEGLENLESLTGYLDISYNSSLDNIDALAQLKSVGSYVAIENNYDLVSINGISNIEPNSIESQNSNYEDLIIYQNSDLSICHVQSVCDILEIDSKSIQIEQNGDGCENKEEVIDNCISNSENLNIENLNIFPNPCHSHILVSSEEQVDYISIVNAYGKTVKKLVNSNQFRHLNIDVSDLNAGVYFVVLSVDSSIVRRKMVKK